MLLLKMGASEVGAVRLPLPLWFCGQPLLWGLKILFIRFSVSGSSRVRFRPAPSLCCEVFGDIRQGWSSSPIFAPSGSNPVRHTSPCFLRFAPAFIRSSRGGGGLVYPLSDFAVFSVKVFGGLRDLLRQRFCKPPPSGSGFARGSFSVRYLVELFSSGR